MSWQSIINYQKLRISWLSKFTCGTNCPSFMIESIFKPISEPFATSARNKSPADKWQKPNFSTIFAHWVPLPLPGPPEIKKKADKFFWNLQNPWHNHFENAFFFFQNFFASGPEKMKLAPILLVHAFLQNKVSNNPLKYGAISNTCSSEVK